jgi:histidyl-tRNA synthetase
MPKKGAKKPKAKKLQAKRAPTKKVVKKFAPAKKPAEEKREPSRRKSKEITLVKGFKDVIPQDMGHWEWITDTARLFADSYGYRQVITPVVEFTELFRRTVGGETDIVQKEMFSFEDKGGDKVTLRPEGTAPTVRAYVEHGMVNLPQPVKMYYIQPMFRYEKPQSGRTRQHFQFGCEIIGDPKPAADAELIILAYYFYKSFGLDVMMQVNSVGDENCRGDYIQALKEYYSSHKRELCEDCQTRYQKNPLRLLDCKEEACVELAQHAPQFVDHLDEECKNHFVKVLEHLDEAEVPYTLNNTIVRGLDYYTRTAFEVWQANEDGSRMSSLGGGGRYDKLVTELGGREETPAVGMGLGIERLYLALREKNIELPKAKKPVVFLAQLGESAKKQAFKLFEDFRQAGVDARAAFTKDALSPQLSIAAKLGVPFTVILGKKELMDNTILLREMETGSQEVIDFKKIIPEIKKRLDKLNNGK